MTDALNTSTAANTSKLTDARVTENGTTLRNTAVKTAWVMSDILEGLAEKDDLTNASVLVTHCAELAFQNLEAVNALVKIAEEADATDMVQDFAAGRALAITMLDEGERLQGGGTAESLRRSRRGLPQVRFASEYLRQLIAEPRLFEGFSAILSAALSMGGSADRAYWEGIADAEYEGGYPGEDGTETADFPDNDESPLVEPRNRSVSSNSDQTSDRRVAGTSGARGLAVRANALLNPALELLDAASEIGSTGDLGYRQLRAVQEAASDLLGDLQVSDTWEGNSHCLDSFYDMQARLTAAAAMEAGKPRAAVLNEALRIVDPISAILDQLPGMPVAAPSVEEEVAA